MSVPVQLSSRNSEHPRGLAVLGAGGRAPDQPAEMVDLEVEGLALASGRYGVSSDRNALRIEDVKEPQAHREDHAAEA